MFSEFKKYYIDKKITYEDFSSIMDQFAKLDTRCLLEEHIKKQLYEFLLEKQDGIVTYPIIETLVNELLLQQEIPQSKSNINPDTIEIQDQNLPKDTLLTLTNEFLQQFKHFYKLIENQYEIDVEYKELETLAKELERTIKINSIQILSYIQPLVNKNQKVKINEFHELCNYLERIFLNQNTNQVNAEIENPNNQVQNLLGDNDEEKKSSLNNSNLFDQQRDYANVIYQLNDMILQKNYVNSYGQQLINNVNQTVKKMDALISILQDNIKYKDKKFEILLKENNKINEQFLFEKELSKTQFQQFEFEIGNKDQTIQTLLQDNDNLQKQMNIFQEQCQDLIFKLKDYRVQQQSITKIESELKEAKLDNKKLNEQIIKDQNEINRLTSNNISLMKIIEELESNQQNQVTTIVQDGKKEVISNYEEKLQELQLQNESLEQLNVNFQKQQNEYEQQIIQLKQEMNYYKQLYENLNIGNYQLSNIMFQRQSEFVNLGEQKGMSKIQIYQPSTISMVTQFQKQRKSQIRPNKQIMESNYNLQNDLQNKNLKISEQDIFKQENIQQQSDQQKIMVKEQENIKQIQCQVEINQEQSQSQKQQSQLLLRIEKFFGGLDKNNIKESRIDPQRIQYNEKQLFQKDFLEIRNDENVKEYLRIENNVHKSLIQKCFSDSIYTIDSKGKRARRIIFITEYTFYEFYGETKPGKISRNFAIVDIMSIIFSECSPIICCIKIAGSNDYLMETFKRAELNQYLLEICNLRRIPQYTLQFLYDFKIKLKGMSNEIYLSEVSIKQKYLDTAKVSKYKVSTKQGWLWLKKNFLLFSDYWKESFTILTNVGLILFENPGDSQPTLFVSLVDAIVIKDPNLITEKPNLIKISYDNSQYEYIFSATSALLQDEWYNIIKQTITVQTNQSLEQEHTSRKNTLLTITDD